VSPPRVAIVSRRAGGLSGAATMILEHARRLSARGWSVHVYAESLDASALEAAGARAHRLPAWPWGSALKRRLFAALAERALRRGGYDLVHGHGDCLRQDILSLHNCVHAAHEAVHGRPMPEQDAVGRLHARILSEGGFRLLIANSRLMREEVIRRFGVPPEKIEVIYPGYDPARFRPQDREALRGEARRELGFSGSDLVAGLITSGDFEKRGVGIFLEALALACRRFPLEAMVVGKESRLGPTMRHAARLGLEGRVRFLAPIPRVERYYHCLDLYVLPALYEEFGMSLQEALACGLPAIAGRRVGAAELLGGEAREFLLETSRPEELSAKIARLADPELRRRLGALGPEAVRGNTWERSFAATYACYERLLAEKGLGQASS